MSADLVSSLSVFKRHAPDFEDIRGGAKLSRLIGSLHVSMGKYGKRQSREKTLLGYEQYSPSPEQIVEKVQHLLDF